MPKDDKVISFIDFQKLGLGFPTHSFVRGLLYFYGLPINDLTPERILHIMTLAHHAL